MPSDSSQDEIRKRATDNLSNAPKKEELTEFIGMTIAIYDQIQRENAKNAVRQEIEKQLEAEIRTKVAMIFTWAFVLLVGSVLLYMILSTLLPEYGCSEDTPRQLVSILQGTFLPVLTLVLGYFFGSKPSS